MKHSLAIRRGEPRRGSDRHARLGWVGLALVALAAGACTTAGAIAKETPIESVASLAGAWTGSLNVGSGNSPCTLTIEPSGMAVLQAPDFALNGTVTVAQGIGTYSFAGKFSGVVTLYQDGDKRELALRGRGATWAWMTRK